MKYKQKIIDMIKQDIHVNNFLQ